MPDDFVSNAVPSAQDSPADRWQICCNWPSFGLTIPTVDSKTLFQYGAFFAILLLLIRILVTYYQRPSSKDKKKRH